MSTITVSKPRFGSTRTIASIAALAISLLGLMLAALVHIGVGARHIGPFSALMALLAYDPRNLDHRIIVDLRLLRLLCGIVAGAALGVAGALLQSVARNPLGEPHILGLNAGASLAVVLASALGGTWLAGAAARPLLASLGAAIVFCLVMSFASSGKNGLTPLKATLCGIALSAFAGSLSAAILILDEQTLDDLRIWLAGDLAGLGYPALTYGAITAAIGMAAALCLAPYLNVLALGDGVARGLGVRVGLVRSAGLVAAAILSGAAVSIAGPIGFLGLVVPHIARRFSGNDMRLLLPLSAIGGASLLLVADTFARVVVAPHELATGVVTALAGAPVFIVIAARSFR